MTSAAAWDRLFVSTLREKGGANGLTLAQNLSSLHDQVHGYDWGASPLLLLVSPASSNYTMEAGKELELLSDGTSRVPVTHGHYKGPVGGVAAPLAVRWALYRVATKGCPRIVSVRDGDRTIAAASIE